MSLDTRTELLIQREIRQSEDLLVKLIQDALDNTDYRKSKKKDPQKKDESEEKKLEESQFRNLIQVSNTTESTEVIKNFLLYQIGRDDKWGRGKKSLANRIINDIDQKLAEKAKSIAAVSKSQDINRIQLELIRRYLGYGARYLTYLNKGKEQEAK